MRGSLFYRFPLSVTLSLLLLVCGTLFIAGYVTVLWGVQREAILSDASRALTGEVTRQQAHLQEHLDHDDLRRTQEELGALGTSLRVRLALLVDPGGRVIAALRRDEVGMALTDSLVKLGLHPGETPLADMLAQVRALRGARVREFPEQGVLLAAAPLDLPTGEARLGQREPGLLLIGWDLPHLYGLARANTWIISQRFLPFVALTTLGFWGLANLLVGRRLSRLSATAERIAEGALEERSALRGRDEIGRLALAFNHMTDGLVAQQAQVEASERRFALAQGFARVGSWEWDIASGSVTWTEGVYRLFGLPPGTPITFALFLELIHPQDRATVRDALARTLEEGVDYEVEARAARGDRWLHSRGDVLRDSDGRAVRMYGLVQDITERKHFESALFNEKERLQVTLTSIADAVVTTDVVGRVTFINPAAEYLSGYSPEGARGRPVTEVLRVVDEVTRRPYPQPQPHRRLDGEGTASSDHPLLVRPDGKEFAIERSVAPIRNREGETIGSVLVFRDVTTAREMAHRFSWQASHDALTGLCNRAAFEERLHQLVHALPNREGPEVHALLYLDLDQFKVVNDVAGHGAGDEVLKEVSGLMQRQVRESDMLARIGGDEFGVILTHCDMAHAQRVADGIHGVLDGFKFSWHGRHFRFGVSIGALEFSPGETSLTDLLRAADLACYTAKHAGRRRTHVYHVDDEHTRRHRSEMDWATRLSEAVEEDRLELHAQPVQALNDEVEGLSFEVLVRMRDPDGTLILPKAFLPAAERFDLVTRIDRWVIAQAFQAVSECLRGPGQRIRCCALNLSGASLGDESLMPYVKQQLALNRLPPEVFCFEITETVAISNLPAAVGLISELRAMGCRFALDDFGSGFCSFSYLKNLPVDYLKIDGTFVRDLGRDPFHRVLVSNINDIGHLLGKQTVAECAEDPETIGILTEIGVDYAQGFAIARPRPIEEFLALTGAAPMPAARKVQGTPT